MDLREKKTKRNIYNAFLQLRSKKALERITVKELCELAEISKATFYLHYRDIYDLSETLQLNTIKDILGYLSDPGQMLADPIKANMEIFTGYYANSSIVSILFGDSQFSKLPECINREIKNTLFSLHPELKDDIRVNIRITFQIMGNFYAYHEYNKQLDQGQVIAELNEIMGLFEEKK